MPKNRQKGGEYLDNRIDKHVDDLVGVFTDPILVFPGGWGDTLPEWLKNAITLERLEMNMMELRGDTPTGTDAEACAYLYTAALTQPMDHDWGQIYLYIATKTYQRWGKNEMPQDIAIESITDDQMRDLNELKAWLYRHRAQVRIERRRAAKRQAKAMEAARAPVQLGLGA
jgi:hypothetical protein